MLNPVSKVHYTEGPLPQGPLNFQGTGLLVRNELSGEDRETGAARLCVEPEILVEIVENSGYWWRIVDTSGE